jgi:alcohol dehydrogenase
LPDAWSYQEGAAYLVPALTAYYALVELANIQEGQRVLIQSGAGGVGIYANRIARAHKAHTIGTVGSRAKIDVLKKENYDQWIVREKGGKAYRQQLKKTLNNNGLDVVLESVGGPYFLDNYLAMNNEGRLIIYGSAQYGQTNKRPNYLKLLWQYLQRPKLDPQKMIEQNKSVMGFNLIYLFHQADRMHHIIGALNKLDIGKPYVGHEFAFDACHEALALFQSGRSTGKIVLNC